ncbi:hypothetical protein GJ496_007539 [Pomphorhynchus laevis]|nr:hypothetical protein GJ496_007539 [Pomphorhynchus laevis]
MSFKSRVRNLHLISDFTREIMREYQRSKVPENTCQSEPCLLKWKLNKSLEEHALNAYPKLLRAFERMNIVFYQQRKLNRSNIKKLGVSPDALCQVSLQLAYFRLHGKLACSYESASLRQFLDGRVDVIRSTSSSIMQLCQSFFKTKCSTQENEDINSARLLKRALDDQTSQIRKVTNGEGIDNYMLALKQLSLESFSSNDKSSLVFATSNEFNKCFHFDLSTSQVTTSIDNSFMFYGPVVDNGYGVCYNIQAASITYVISAMINGPANAGIFKEILETILLRINELLQKYKDESIA